MRPALSIFGLAGLLLAGTIGCGGDGLTLADVSGTITLDGKPVPNAFVTFIPQGSAGSPSTGVTDASGNYTLRFSRDRDGVLPGKHDVTIITEKIPPDDVADMKSRGETVPEFVPIPARYGQPGELTGEVDAGGGTLDFDLNSEPAK